jgi:alpha-galactosidase
LKYGVDQCVGDTICAGGILYGQRNIVILDFCKDIREVAEPGAIFLNYANPMAMNMGRQPGGVQTIKPRRAARRHQIAGAGGRGQQPGLCLLGDQPPDLVHRHPCRAQDREGQLIAAREAPCLPRQEKVRIDV